ncbi:MAG: dienelactone hydrolase family protein [Candidatus Tectimicrobiota bacterium]
MRRLLLCALAIALAACHGPLHGLPATANAAGGRETVQFPGPGVTLSGELFLPVERAVPARSPAIVLLHGCGGMYTARGQLTDRHHDWARRLAGWGFVALLVDSLGPRHLGSLCPLKERPIQAWQERSRDAYAALEYLTARADVDASRVFVMGWSHGGSTVMGVVRPEAPGLRADGPRFKAAIAYYPGCTQPLRRLNYRPSVPLVIQHGAADDWVPAAPCVVLAENMQRLGLAVTIHLYAEAHHGFDAPTGGVRFLPQVYNPRAPGERGAHVGRHEAARLQAIAATKHFIEHHLAH